MSLKKFVSCLGLGALAIFLIFFSFIIAITIGSESFPFARLIAIVIFLVLFILGLYLFQKASNQYKFIFK
ncbi:MAG: hypothetical protein AABX11_01060 [Nanoarchaeota archaeon]